VRFRHTAVIIGLALALTACSSGSPTTTTPETPKRPQALDGVDPCTLISAQDAGKLGIKGNAHNASLGTATTACGWVLPDTYYATVGLFPTVGLGDITFSGTVTQSAVNDRQAKKVVTTTDSGKCLLYMSVTAHSSVQVEVSKTSGGDTSTACYGALKVGFVIDPRLPLG
jgi:Protein of unknown function (DUF3558)